MIACTAPNFEFLCVMHIGHMTGGGGGGREQQEEGRFWLTVDDITETASDCLVSWGSFSCWPMIVRKSCTLRAYLAQQLWNCVEFSWIYMAELKEKSSPWGVGPISLHDIIRIVFYTLNVIDHVGQNSPHAMGWAPLIRHMGEVNPLLPMQFFHECCV